MMFSLTPTRLECPECERTDQQELCPFCYGAKLVDINTLQDWILEKMELGGCNPLELNSLREEKPDFLTLVFCVEVLKILFPSNSPSNPQSLSDSTKESNFKLPTII